jgi:hypothetical protein
MVTKEEIFLAGPSYLYQVSIRSYTTGSMEIITRTLITLWLLQVLISDLQGCGRSVTFHLHQPEEHARENEYLFR